MSRRGLIITIPNGKTGMAEAAVLMGTAFFLYENSYEAIGHCCKMLFGEGFWIDNVILSSLLLVCSLPFTIGYIQSRKKLGIGFLIIIVFVTLVSVLLNPTLWNFIEPISWRMFLCWYLYAAFQYIDFDIFIQKVLGLKWFFLILFIASYFLLENERYIDSAKQVIAYNVATISVLFFIAFIKADFGRYRTICLASFCLTVVLTLAMSSRGALVGILVAVGLIVASSYRKFGIVIIAFGLLSMNLEGILQAIANILNFFKIDSRITMYLNASSFFAQEGRYAIYNAISNAISENGFFGSGICSDRLYLLNHLGYETYSHNIALEIICEFGWFVGIGILVVALFLFLNTMLRKEVSPNIKLIMCLYSVGGLSCLMFSGSYLTSNAFFIMISIGIVVLKNRNLLKESDSAEVNIDKSGK